MDKTLFSYVLGITKKSVHAMMMAAPRPSDHTGVGEAPPDSKLGESKNAGWIPDAVPCPAIASLDVRYYSTSRT